MEERSPEQPGSSSAAVSTLSVAEPTRSGQNASQIGKMKPRSESSARHESAPPSDEVVAPPAQAVHSEEGVSTPQSSLPLQHAASSAKSSPPPAPVKAPPAVLVPTEPRRTRQAASEQREVDQQREKRSSPQPQVRSRRVEQAREPAMSTPPSELSVAREASGTSGPTCKHDARSKMADPPCLGSCATVTPAAPRKAAREQTGHPVAREPKTTEFKQVSLTFFMTSPLDCLSI
jgi:hypothetical protein